MMRNTILWLVCAALLPGMGALAASAQDEPDQPTTDTEKAKEEKPLEPGLYAIFETSMGKIVCRLFPDKAPKTVDNFVGLAKGEKEWKDPKTDEIVKRPFYDGLIFHRVIPSFMIQGGCPLGTGTGGPGYKFADEFDPALRFDQVGRLAMANSGPGTNGSQFFITVKETPWLSDKHTIFGQVVVGQDIAVAMTEVERNSRDKPLEDITLKKLTIKEVK